jgi:eukaryotic-like serine/threonine-protein kinase
MDHHLYAVDPENGRLIWKANLNGSIVGTPVLEDGVLYVGSFASSMSAINADNGAILWTTPVSNWVWAGPAFHEGRLYFGDLGGSLYALEAETGSIVWETQPDGPVTATPYVDGQMAYFATEDGVLKALNLDGIQQWSQPVGGPVYANPTPANDLILVSPINTDPLVIGMNLNGTQRWTFVPPS